MARLFKEKEDYFVPQTAGECCKRDVFVSKLWEWSEAVDNIGAILSVAILVFGAIMSFSASKSGDNIKWDLFIPPVIKYVIFTVLCYVVHHTLAFFLGSLACIVKNTKISAMADLLSIEKENRKEKEAKYRSSEKTEKADDPIHID